LETIRHYFPDLTPQQESQFLQLKTLYSDWNNRINVISRKDFDNFYERHVLHSLGIAKVYSFLPGMQILDVGTGGGFPGIPLAILFPETQFLLVDSIGKKITVVKDIAEKIGLQNVSAMHLRAEEVKGTFDFIISRAVTAMPIFVGWVKHKIKKGTSKDGFSNGILYLKGGDLSEEFKGLTGKFKTYPLASYFSEEFFETKKVIHWVN